MTVIAKSDQCAALWLRVLAQVQAHLHGLAAHPARTVVLVPYAQLMPWAQRYWALHHADGCTGVLPPPPQLPPAIRHQLPMPSEV